MKSIAFIIFTRLDDPEGRAEEGVGGKGTMLMAVEGRKEPIVRNQPNEEGEPSKYAVKVQKQMRAEADESVLSHSWTFDKKFPLHSIWSGGESQRSVMKTLCISNTWSFAWLLSKKQINVIGSRKQETWDRNFIYLFIHRDISKSHNFSRNHTVKLIVL